jgi:hypothetical protein
VLGAQAGQAIFLTPLIKDQAISTDEKKVRGVRGPGGTLPLGILGKILDLYRLGVVFEHFRVVLVLDDGRKFHGPTFTVDQAAHLPARVASDDVARIGLDLSDRSQPSGCLDQLPPSQWGAKSVKKIMKFNQRKHFDSPRSAKGNSCGQLRKELSVSSFQ